MSIVLIFVLVVVIAVWLFVRHQRSLRRRAYLMREAIRNRDWSFRLNTRGLTSGERAMQEVMNDLGEVIHQQVNQREVESWERLTRVLTHEIMNATAPIASISQSLLRRDDVVGTPLEAGIRSINATATRLTTFVDSYRKLSQLQQPKPEDVYLDAFFVEVQRLYPQLTWDVVGMEGVVLHTDPVLLQQVVVNLVKNAVEAGARRIKTHPQPSLVGRELIPSRTEKIAVFKGNNSLPTREGGGRVSSYLQRRRPHPRRRPRQHLHPFLHDQARRHRHRPRPLTPDHGAPGRRPRTHGPARDGLHCDVQTDSFLISEMNLGGYPHGRPPSVFIKA